VVIQILGLGCTKCNMLEEQARQAVEELGDGYTVEKITNLEAIQEMGVLVTPALAIDGVVKSAGKVLNKEQILQLIQGKQQSFQPKK
jgi:small redox-active disulfide protein 2